MKIFPLTLIPDDTRIDFMKMRWVSLGLAALLLVASVAGIVVKGFNYALDFTGGTVVELRFDGAVDVEGVRERLDAAGYAGAQVQPFGSGSDVLTYPLRLEALVLDYPTDEAAAGVIYVDDLETVEE